MGAGGGGRDHHTVAGHKALKRQPVDEPWGGGGSSSAHGYIHTRVFSRDILKGGNIYAC